MKKILHIITVGPWYESTFIPYRWATNGNSHPTEASCEVMDAFGRTPLEVNMA